MRSWDDTTSLHDQAVVEYAAAAAAVKHWDHVPAAKKWSAAQITAHLNLAFEAIIREVNGGPPMKLRTTSVQRFVMRFTVQRRLMNGGPFPHGAPAPRETRPPAVAGNREEAVAEFRRLADELNSAIAVARKKDEGVRFRHPYFGYMPAVDGLYIAARHIDHHTQQIIGR